MDNLLLYLLKVSAGTSLLYLCYLLLFRKDTFYLRNRIFLILILLLPLFFPAFKTIVLTPAATPAAITSGSFTISESSVTTTVSAAVKSFDYNRLFRIIYFTVAGLLLVRVIISLLSTYSIIRKGRIRSNRFPKVVVCDDQLPPFSFFPYAVIPSGDFKSGNYTDLLDHEFAHIRQGHTFDLILSELFIAFQWFNPVIWIVKRSIVLNHEYLADQVSLSNKSVKEYQYRLLNFQSGLRHISLAHNFNSLIKNRIIMINKKPTRKYAALKIVIILPVVAILAWSFATPEYRSVPVAGDPMTIYEAPAIFQQGVKGIVLKEDGKALEGVDITNTGTMGHSFLVKSDKDGKFSIANIETDATIFFYCKGYKKLQLKADFTKEMVVKMEKDPDAIATDKDQKTNTLPQQMPARLVVIDGVITDKTINAARTDLGYNMGIGKMLMGKDATDKYGEKGANGVYEITTRKKALEMGLKPPFPRLAPQDFPTFQGKDRNVFAQWIADNAKYPAEAKEKNIQGWVSLSFTIGLDGSLSNIVTNMTDNKLLSDEIERVVKSAPKWEGPKNKDVDEPYQYFLTLRFKLPDQILSDAPFVVVEEMPYYINGGDKGLLEFIKKNIKYPEELKKEKIEGKVIVRFNVNTEGKTDAISILKGVHPLMDAEAIRVISALGPFKPGKQGGVPVNVWYMAPVTFSLTTAEKIFTKTSEVDILKFIGMNTAYPQEAKAVSDTGTVYIVLKLQKGGTVKELNAYTDKKDVKAPFLNEVIVVGYKSADALNAPAGVRTAGTDHPLLKLECLKVANKLTVNEIPDWNDKDLEFAIPVKFMLK